MPSSPTKLPTTTPTSFPSLSPSSLPSNQPTSSPSIQPSSPTNLPSAPTRKPTPSPTTTPTSLPTFQPTSSPSNSPTSMPSTLPTVLPTSTPTPVPSNQPSASPTLAPTSPPSISPTLYPTNAPTLMPSNQPSASPTNQPTLSPTNKPTLVPSTLPTQAPTPARYNCTGSSLTCNIVQLFRSVRSRHDITFNSTQEKILAIHQFQKNLNQIEHFNLEVITGNLRFGLSQFSMSNLSSFRDNNMGAIIPSTNPLHGSVIVHGRPRELVGISPQAIKVDWTGVYTTAIKNQGKCGCCYVFSAVAQIESDAMRLNHTSPLMQLSPQQPLDCGGAATALGCGGGFPLNIYAYARRSGLVRHDLYPYQGGPNKLCKYFNSTAPIIVSVVKFHVFQSHTEADMAVYIQNVGPLAAIVYADKWQHYTFGIMTAAACGYSGKVNHAVQIVGVDYSDPTSAYWIVSTLCLCHLSLSGCTISTIPKNLLCFRFGTSGQRHGV